MAVRGHGDASRVEPEPGDEHADLVERQSRAERVAEQGPRRQRFARRVPINERLDLLVIVGAGEGRG